MSSFQPLIHHLPTYSPITSSYLLTCILFPPTYSPVYLPTCSSAQSLLLTYTSSNMLTSIVFYSLRLIFLLTCVVFPLTHLNIFLSTHMFHLPIYSSLSSFYLLTVSFFRPTHLCHLSAFPPSLSSYLLTYVILLSTHTYHLLPTHFFHFPTY